MSPHSEEFAEVYELHVEKIYNYFFYRLYDRECAEDLTADVFTRAHDKFSQFNSQKGSVQAWLYGIARHRLLDYWRRHKTVVSLDDAVQIAGDDDVQQRMVILERSGVVSKWMGSLKPDQRELITLRLWDGLSFAEIAQLTGKSEGSCKMTWSRLVKKARLDLQGAALVFVISLMYLS